MWIEQLIISAYKSLYEVEIVPQQLNILAGPNNAGKSNLVEAVDFLTDTYTHGLELAVSRKGGFESIAFRRKRRTRRPISFAVHASTDAREMMGTRFRLKEEQNPTLSVSHRFSIEATSRTRDTDFQVADEKLSVTSPDLSTRRVKIIDASRRLQNISVTAGSSKRLRAPPLEQLLTPFDVSGFRQFLTRRTNPTDLLIESASFNSVASTFADEMGRSRTFQLSPLECREPGVPVPNPQLERHGRNLPALVRHLKRRGSRAWPRVLSGLRRIIPDLEDVELEFTQDRRLTLRFVEFGTGRPWSSEEVSDGTIQALAMFCVLHDPRSALVVIEEPENSVHPWIVRVLLEECRKANKQIFLTTHSPVLLEQAKPDEVSVVWKEEGRTRVEPLTRLEPEAASMLEEGKLSVYDILDTGWLYQSVPPGPDEASL